MKKNDNNLFFTCSLIEYIGRITKNLRGDIVSYLAMSFSLDISRRVNAG